jgi:23S rRNA (cytidine2498-2'-O)-methyltransferase
VTLHVCQAGYEKFLAKELKGSAKTGPGWAEGPDGEGELCFAHYSLKDPVRVEGKSVNAVAWAIADRFMETARDERFDAPWPLLI